ncbi:DUF3164 family protein [Pseudomonas citronellolis]|uniref:DUF3164 family protein n=1 Tax=Pseudomonas citronellolis TaxID=53408 RepID=UPI00248DDEFB|nr:DUF3164 family protein [Pseudomonas citronellolis]
MTANAIPAGYRQDAQGRLVHESLIKPIDQARDKLVLELVEKGKALNKLLAEFKDSAFGDVTAFVEMSIEEYGVKRRGKKGNVSLLSFDGSYMIKKAVQESVQFDERLQAARALIDECLLEWTEGARPEVVTLVNDAFRADTKGEIRTARVLALRRLEIADERWQRAMKSIGDACQVVGSKDYIRLYERVGDTDQFKAIPLDIAGV